MRSVTRFSRDDNSFAARSSKASLPLRNRNDETESSLFQGHVESLIEVVASLKNLLKLEVYIEVMKGDSGIPKWTNLKKITWGLPDARYSLTNLGFAINTRIGSIACKVILLSIGPSYILS